MASPSIWIAIELVYALPTTQSIVALCVRRGTTVAEAIEISGISALYPEINPATARLGIYGKETSLLTQLNDEDRIEIYRPLIADPKQTRRNRSLKRRSDSH